MQGQCRIREGVGGDVEQTNTDKVTTHRTEQRKKAQSEEGRAVQLEVMKVGTGGEDREEVILTCHIRCLKLEVTK